MKPVTIYFLFVKWKEREKSLHLFIKFITDISAASFR